MSTYFERHPQRVDQWQPRRRNNAHAVPQVVVHTYEAPAGMSAEQGATGLVNRTGFGSYHWLADALGSPLHLAPWSAETWHCVPSNNWSVGISMMAYAAGWPKLTKTQRDNLVNGAALGAHRFSRWCVAQGLGPVPARRITRAQAMRREAGFISHGEMDPGRRSDPGANFPWSLFLAEFQRLEVGGKADNDPTPPKENEDDMPKLDEVINLADSTKPHLQRDRITYGGLSEYAGAGGWEAMKRLPRIDAELKRQRSTVNAILKAVNAGDVSAEQIGRVVAREILPDLAEVVAAAASEYHNADEIAAAVVAELSARLSDTTEG